MTGNDENPFMKVLEVDEETIETLDKIAAMDRGQQPVMALDDENEEAFLEFAKQNGISDLPESQELLQLIRTRDQNREHARKKVHNTIGPKKRHAAESDSVQSSGSSAVKIFLAGIFLAGLGIGIGLGILFAPMSGEETRENLTQRASDLADSARELANQSRDKVRTTVSAMRGQADRFASTVKEATGTETRNL